MYCKWCGLDSKKDNACEWCGKPFVGEADDDNVQPTTAINPAPAVTVAMKPQTGSANSAVSHQDDAVVSRDEESFGERLEKYMAVMLFVIAGGMAFAHYMPDKWLFPFLGALFLSGLLMGALRVIDFFEDDINDVALLLICTLLLGPVYATGVYLVICLVKHEVNVSLLGLMASYFVIRFAIGSAAHGAGDTIGHLITIHFTLGLVPMSLYLFPSTILVGGWICASFFRPFDR